MAIFRFEAKVGKNPSHFDYIMREGEYKSRKDLEYKKEFNVPKQFENAKDFFNSAFSFERINGNIYREYLITLPKEMSNKENIEIAERFLKETFKDKYVYAYAMHSGKGDNPHIHCMFSERELDEKERSKQNFFKRYNGKESGGARKDWEKFHDKTFLRKLRKDWEIHLNKYLKAKGIEEVSCESNKKQQKIAEEKGEFLKAEILKRKKHTKKKYINPTAYKEEAEEIKKDNENINRVLKDYKKEVIKKETRKYKNKTFKEILELKEKLETDIFRLNKKLDDKNITNIALNNLTNGEINKLKNEKRKLFKVSKELYKDPKVRQFNKKKKISDSENVKKYIQIKNRLKLLDDKIDSLKLNINSNKLIDEKLKIKSNYLKQFEKIKSEYKIIDKFFLEKLKTVNKNSEDGLLYKLYIKKQDLKEIRKEVRENFYKNKEILKKEIPEFRKTKSKNIASKIEIIKSQNKKLKQQNSKIGKILTQFKREIQAKNELKNQTKFVLKDIDEILNELEFEERGR